MRQVLGPIGALATINAVSVEIDAAQARALDAHERLLAAWSLSEWHLARVCVQAHLIYERGYWNLLKRPDGSPYLSPDDYFVETLKIVNWRSAQRYIRAGQLLILHPDQDRAMAIAEGVGIAKLDVIAGVALEEIDEDDPDSLDPARAAEIIEGWARTAAKEPVHELARLVRVARGIGPPSMAATPEDGPWSQMLGWMPDLEGRALLEAAMRCARRLLGQPVRGVGLLIAMAAEFVSSNPERARTPDPIAGRDSGETQQKEEQ